MNYDWVQPTLERISDILRMPGVNNSFGTPKVDPKAAWSGVKLLWLAANACTPAPLVCPTKLGGLSFNWSGLETAVDLVMDPGKPAQVTTSGRIRPGDFASADQVLESAFRVIEGELGRPCPEAAAAP